MAELPARIGEQSDEVAETPAAFVSRSIHAINNPLFAILGLVEFLLADANPGTRAHERLVLIRDSALEIKELAEQLRRHSSEWDVR